MDRVSVAAIVIGLVALFLATAGLVSAPEGARDVKKKTPAVREGLTEAKKELSALKSEVAKVSSGRNQVLGRIAELRSKVSVLSGQTARLDRTVGELAKRPAAAAAGEVKIDQEMVGRLMREEFRAVIERMRQARGGGGRPDMSAKGLRESIGLSEEKADKLAKLYKERNDAIGKIWRENRGGGREKNIALMREVQKKNEAAVAELLTPEQVKKYQDMRNRGRRGGRRPTTPQPRPAGRNEPATGEKPVF